MKRLDWALRFHRVDHWESQLVGLRRRWRWRPAWARNEGWCHEPEQKVRLGAGRSEAGRPVLTRTTCPGRRRRRRQRRLQRLRLLRCPEVLFERPEALLVVRGGIRRSCRELRRKFSRLKTCCSIPKPRHLNQAKAMNLRVILQKSNYSLCPIRKPRSQQKNSDASFWLVHWKWREIRISNWWSSVFCS